ncbi:MAG: hypothetical protein IPK75_20335 [Acidobacteria bacterium]|nr:hypothetical protein [Acidobacteriota bacterium]
MPSKKKKADSTKQRCKNCNKPFTPTVSWQEFCKEPCRKAYWRHGGITETRLLDLFREAAGDHLAALTARVDAIEQLLATIATMPVLASQLATRLDTSPNLQTALQDIRERIGQAPRSMQQ